MITTDIIPTPAIFETDRLYLREYTPKVCQQLFASCSDAEITEFLGIQSEKELAEEKENFKKGISTWFVSFHNFHLLDKQSGKVLGRCGYHTWIPKHRRAELGYHLFHDKDKAKGLMTEALGPILAYGFEQMNLYRIEALLADYNIPSYKLLKRYGFKEEGTVRGHYIVNSVNEDSLMVSLLLPEYEALKSNWGLQEQPL
ncbi:ribosomal-protein-alanine N-acetyltransferase [Pontibacter aydingkolensis]|uniref:GNAT family N-acetyltransferase n=1 Tax=Pontibacter aydingkolensis TaxID=1911536 RepID=A0ABS7CV96_9BACT|nr:GNAT family protein [Pontibacter aydingkolensis]MBW7467611.1 GNAT family N-acetyltransferase [Pontibacter aydingkolensis]